MPKFLLTPIDHDPFDPRPVLEYAAKLGGAPDHKVFDETIANLASLPQRMLGDPLDYVGRGLLGQTSVEIGPNGEIPPIDPKLVDASNALAGFAMEGGLAMPRPENSLGVFGGVRAKTADMVKLEQAIRAEQGGVSADKIWQATGWGRGKDGKWRFEIPDHKASYDESVIKAYNPGEDGVAYRKYIQDYANAHGADDFYGLTEAQKIEAKRLGREHIGAQSTLGKVLDHPALFEAYPALKNMSVKSIEEPGISGSYNPTVNELETSPVSHLRAIGDDRPLDIILHETQHAIQSREDFAMGGSPEEPKLAFTGSNIKAQVMSRLKTLEQIEHPTAQDIEERFYLRNLYRKIANASSGHVGYQTLAGEVESRNVETRRAGRVKTSTPPWMTEDVPNDLQHVRIIDQWRKNSNE